MVMLKKNICLTILFVFSYQAFAAPATTIPRQGDISATLHNLSASGGGATKATTESQICAFCHTPHAADDDATSLGAPLWNRSITMGNDSTYIEYDSSSIQANVDANPGGSSKLCLSCHDGTLALGNLNIIDGQFNQSIAMSSTNMPDGSGALTGFTRNLGQDLSGDHPISFKFNAALLAADDELRKPSQSVANKKYAPLELNKVQCATCHDPHVSGQDLPAGTSIGPTTTDNNIKFLRTRRFQMSDPQGGNFDKQNDIVCLACHDKMGTAWASSVHADSSVANETYKATAADERQFPRSIAVWQAACLNCHDTHTVQGANRLLREGTDSSATPKSGGNPALEETCFQCHTSATDSILNTAIANIETDFSKSIRMPLNRYNGSDEVHDISDADFTEGNVPTPTAGATDPNNANLGYGDLSRRHAECTDCHNPHRMVRNSLADGSGNSSQGTHTHASTHNNKISGVLKGTWGVEPVYDSGSNGRKFGTSGGLPLTYSVKSGLSTNKVEFEYQICLKCHSDYAFADDGGPDNAVGTNSNGRPQTGGSGLTSYSALSTTSETSSGQTNSMRNYTNQAMEFQSPSSHSGNAGGGNGTDGGACSDNDGVPCKQFKSAYAEDFNNNNHRSWHPVMAPTGRTTGVRGISGSGAWRSPWTSIGTQTMYCTDCHGSDNGSNANVEPSTGGVWGPHGSNRNYLLKGEWTGTSQDGSSGNNFLCFKCHNNSIYDGGSSGSTATAFEDGGSKDNLHSYHSGKAGSTYKCLSCHVAVPHGWKNRSFLVNLNDIGPEVMCRAIDADPNGYDVEIAAGGNCVEGQPIPPGSALMGNTPYTNPPYYINARLRIDNFPNDSGIWAAGKCAGQSRMESDMC